MPDTVLSELAHAELKNRNWRIWKDRLFGLAMAVGGVTVIAAILTIFVYLLVVVFPLFEGADMATRATVPLAAGEPLELTLNEYGDVAFGLDADGAYRFVDVATGDLMTEGSVLPAGERPAPGVRVGVGANGLAFALAGGRALLVAPAYEVSFANDRRAITPSLAHPFGEEPIDLGTAGEEPRLVTAALGEDAATVAAWTAANRLVLTHVTRTLSLLEDEATVEVAHSTLEAPSEGVAYLAIDADQNELYVVGRGGHVRFFDIRNKENPRLVEDLQVVPPGVEVTAVAFLSGGVSLLVGDSRGLVAQWFPVRDAQNNFRLTRIREFEGFRAPIRLIEPEHARKGFVAIDEAGTLGLFHTTAERRLLLREALVPDARHVALSQRADVLAVLTGTGTLASFAVDNEHPEVSWQALWGRVWYEGRSQPEFVWQSSAATSDFEPKLSLTPLTFGTFKAAVYAMFFAIPIAILGALYTAYFMNPRLRVLVKPSIEIMAALPTVILGFLAGLWLAPYVESHLIGIFAAFVLMPASVVVAALVWSQLPLRLQARLPAGTEVFLIIPLLCLVLAGCMAASQPLEQLWFDGNLPRWLTNELGITYEQRNSLVVGIAMGFAVIPNIYSISEDAVFGVPKHLSTGSLALGATPWQTVTRVVLLTASPGIFSAVMIGLGRAVGETMIVLMATGNTPIIDMNLFEGFRALSANIAVEMPESEVGSTHYRVLFLAALVLFLVTFVFNTLAEVVRQRLRAKYANL